MLLKTVLATVALAGTVFLFALSEKTPGKGLKETRANHDSRPSVDWGLYQIYWGPEWFGRKLNESLEAFASRPDYVMFYRDLGRPFPAEGIRIIRQTGATPIISLELWRWHDSSKRYLPDIVSGGYDDAFRKWAKSAKEEGDQVLLRFGFEFNGDWFTWQGKPELFVASWRRVHGIFREVGATNVEWVWCPNMVSCPNTPSNDMHSYYPGDAYVDWLGLDGYNWGDHHDEWHKWESFEELFAKPIEEFAARYQGKRVMICETGSVEGKPGQKAAWLKAAYETLERWSQVEAVVWFHFDKRREGEQNWRLDSSEGSLAAFNETFASGSGKEHILGK